MQSVKWSFSYFFFLKHQDDDQGEDQVEQDDEAQMQVVLHEVSFHFVQ